VKASGAKQTGKLGEDMAAAFLLKHGFQVLTRNYRFARGEIDIVARSGNLLVFVEVKTARTLQFGRPETWVDRRKQQQIGMVAQRYLQEFAIDDMDCRFDVIAISKEAGRWKINHIKNAFWLEENGY